MMKLNGEEPKRVLERKATLRLKIIEINDQNGSSMKMSEIQ
jgi:hypothetical protein